MPRAPTKLQREAYAFYQEVLWKGYREAYWENESPGDSPPTHYVLERELYDRLLSWLHSTAGRANPLRKQSKRGASRGARLRQLRRYEALYEEFAARGESNPSRCALDAMLEKRRTPEMQERARAALERGLSRARVEEEQSRRQHRELLEALESEDEF